VAVAVGAYRNVEIDLVVHRVRLLLAQVPGDARTAQHGAGEAEIERTLRRDHADADRALLPDAVVGEQRLVLVDGLREAVDEVLDEVEQGSGTRLVELVELLLAAELRRLVLRHAVRQVAVDAAGTVVA